jgi:hypothetical protein
MTGVRVRSREVAPPPPRASEGPAPGFFEGAAASLRVTVDDVGFVQDQRLSQSYASLAAALEEQGEDGRTLRRPLLSVRGITALVDPFGDDSDYWEKDAIWTAIARRRARDPKAFAGIPATREAFELDVLNRKGDTKADERTASRAGILANLAGGAIGSQADPVNMAANLLSFGGSTVLRQAGRAAIGNMAVQAAQTPLLDSARERRGSDLTAEEAVLNIGAAGLGGAAFPVIAKGIGMGGKAVADVRPRVAEWVRNRQPIDRRLAAALSREALPEVVDPSLRAIAAREIEIDDANPFVADGAGIAAHRDRLAAAMDMVLARTPAARARASQMLAQPLASPGLAGDGYDPAALKAAIRGPESGGDDRAVNRMGSSASGRYQFVRGTFMGIYRQVYGGGAADARAAWDNKRFDPATQEALMDRLMANNANVLRRNGLPVNNGSMYALHVLGEGDGPKLMRADPGTPVADVLSAAIVRQNPSYFGGGKTAGEALAIIASKVGGPSPAAPRAANALDDPAMADLNARQARLDAAQAQADGLPPAPMVFDDGPAVAAIAPAPMRALPDPVVRDDIGIVLSPRAQDIRPALVRMIDDPRISLNKPAAIAKIVDADEADVRAVLTELAARGRIVQRKDGHFARLPPRSSQPDDVLRTIARAGGLRDDEGHALGLKSLSAEQRREMITDARRAWRRSRETGGRNLQVSLGRAGKLLRPNGRSIEEVGELLWERGFFGAPETTPRPPIDEVLDLIERARSSDTPIYVPGEEPVRAPTSIERAAMDDEQRDIIDRMTEKVRDQFDIAINDDLAMELYYRMADDPAMELDEAVRDMILEINDRVYDDYFTEIGAEGYDEIEAQLSAARRAAREDVDRSAFDPGDTSARGGAGGDAQRDFDAQGPDPLALARFDNPTGPTTQSLDDSLAHDVDMLLGGVGPESPPIRFVTAKGSKYEIEADGTTSRNKAYRAEHGPDEQGLQPRSQATFYVSAQDAIALAEFQAIGGPKTAIQALPDGRIGLRYLEGKDVGKFERRTVVTPRTGPAVGLTPVETWNDGTRVHFGNEIISIERAPVNNDADMLFGPTGSETRAALEAAGERRLAGAVAQKPPGSDGGLFDTQDRTGDLFVQVDPDGEPRPLADVLRDLDEDDASWATMRSCMIPPNAGDGA